MLHPLLDIITQRLDLAKFTLIKIAVNHQEKDERFFLLILVAYFSPNCIYFQIGLTTCVRAIKAYLTRSFKEC